MKIMNSFIKLPSRLKGLVNEKVIFNKDQMHLNTIAFHILKNCGGKLEVRDKADYLP